MIGRSLLSVLLAAAGVMTLGSPVRAQALGQDCVFEDGTESATRRSLGGVVQVNMVKARIRCADGVVLRGDTIRYYGSRGLAELIGNVFYADSTREMTAVAATYYRDNRQLVANGDPETDVIVTNTADGARLSGINLIYYQAGGGRIEDEVTVFGLRGAERPRALLPPPTRDEPPAATSGVAELDREVDPAEEKAPAADASASPLDVTADRIILKGENYFEALGRVESFRDSVTTSSDTLIYDQVSSNLDLRGNARLVQVRDTIEGRRVLVRIPDNVIREIEATGDGVLVSADLRLEAPWFRVAFDKGDLDGLWAAPLRRNVRSEEEESETPPLDVPEPSEAPPEPEVDLQQAMLDSLDARQPYAISGQTRIRADSLDVASESGRIEQLVAVGRAYAVSARDSTLDVSRLPEIARQDWMRGDTIVASFAARSQGDSTVYAIERITATGSASSLYRLAPDSARAANAPEESARAEAQAVDVPPPDSTGTADVAVTADSLGLPAEEPTVVLPADAPGIHYVVAAQIILVFENDDVSRMEVLQLQEGVHLEPRRARAAPTTSTAPPPGGGLDHD